MIFATKEAMVARFGEQELVDLTDRDGSTGAIVEEVLDVALTDANGTAMAYLNRYTNEQLTPAPQPLVKVTCDLARYALYDDQPGEAVEKRYEAAVKFLEQLASGKVTLGLPDPEPEQEPVDTVEMESSGCHWKRENATGYV